jgi:putative (di)nucleoside polyphosphate hydrolase
LVFTVIDSEGYRPNVGIILCNADGRLFWAKRIGQYSWQFPQGGIRRDESPEQAMFRELAEEVGLRPEHVQVIGCTRGWLRYRLPKRLIRRGNHQTCIGQKQVWFLLRMLGGEDAVCLDSSERPEFDHWQWVDYWYPLRAVVPFKRHVYWRALCELAPLLVPFRLPKRPFPAGRRSEEAETFGRPASRGVGFDRPPEPVRTLEVAMEVTMEVVALTARPPEPAWPAAAVKPTPVLPRRRVETCPHPVITRMVVSARRGGVLEPMTVVATPAVAPSLEGPRSPGPPAPRSRRYSRR